jgi:hypothetical protein
MTADETKKTNRGGWRPGSGRQPGDPMKILVIYSIGVTRSMKNWLASLGPARVRQMLDDVRAADADADTDTDK